jgi:hypothetical protein
VDILFCGRRSLLQARNRKALAAVSLSDPLVWSPMKLFEVRGKVSRDHLKLHSQTSEATPRSVPFVAGAKCVSILLLRQIIPRFSNKFTPNPSRHRSIKSKFPTEFPVASGQSFWVVETRGRQPLANQEADFRSGPSA